METLLPTMLTPDLVVIKMNRLPYPKSAFVETIKDNALAFVIGWVVGMGLWPVLWESITNL
jgi:hypothetical protein